MGGIALTLYLVTAFAGGLTSGVAGFALGLVVSGVWLHIMTPAQVAFLISCCGLVSQIYGMWHLRSSMDWSKAAPFMISGVIGVPLGAVLLTYIDPNMVKTGMGVLLTLYGSYGLLRPALVAPRPRVSADVGVGFVNGLISGMTGLGGVLITLWCQAKGWPKDVQRAVFQPVLFVVLAMSAASLAVAGAMTVQTMKLYLIGLPVLLAGTWVGFRLYGRLDEAAFRKLILLLLLLSGLSLIAPDGMLQLILPRL
ncbi:MAG TPA: sulfite exporter TauE/SafE family protein [Pseudolabrys sp.]|nr:sulfite exporter TauE/SafE family protein [Pseudolabrys sp.]